MGDSPAGLAATMQAGARAWREPTDPMTGDVHPAVELLEASEGLEPASSTDRCWFRPPVD